MIKLNNFFKNFLLRQTSRSRLNRHELITNQIYIYRVRWYSQNRYNLYRKTPLSRDGHGTGLPVPRIFVPGTWVPKLKIPGLSQGFLSQSQESQGFASHGTTLGLPEFLGLLGTRVPGTVPGFRNFSKEHDLLIMNATHFFKMNPYCTQIIFLMKYIKISIKLQIKKKVTRPHEVIWGH